ncbi:flagellar hook-associated protein 3 FlgL [Aneurinibacillus soli]|uniref:Flagellar hook-associated protein 3 n=1 Tax=Aneurinibacillus soli TaxID=1500254 RepID=A0A0U5B702_9BACL|nr:flagellar hook-associated protein FlgL [Aneurinibacillus soli]PYE61488.1 flagellar hook-associated protein 3 FlgL [Aneurinibacillus soli]BAU26557.1 Flagellar hook-associated protein 3 [Aneurinibacillus soli]
MRVTQNMLNNTMMRNLNNSLNRMDKLQNMMSSGKKISKPSDDPVIASRGMLYRTSIGENEQFKENTGAANDWMTESETAVGEVGDVLSRVKELITQASNDTINQGDREKIRDEIIQLRDHLGTVANATLNGRYLFNGTNTDQAPFANGVYGSTNNEDINLEVSQGIKMPMNVDGIQLFGQSNPGVSSLTDFQSALSPSDKAAYDKAGGTDLFSMMNTLIEKLKPSEYATDQYGRTLAADATGRPIFDASGKSELYDPNDHLQTKLKNESFVRGAEGQLLAADKNGDPILDLTDPTNPTVKVYDPTATTPMQWPLKKNTSGSKLLAYDKTDTAVPKSIVLYDPTSTNQVPLVAPENKMAPVAGKELSGYLDVIQKHTDNFLQVRAEIGSRMNRLQLVQDRLDSQNGNLKNMMSNGEDADMAQVIMDLQNNENVHKAALAAGSRIIQPTLLDFLR